MNFKVCGVLISFWLHLFLCWVRGAAEERSLGPKGFLTYRTVSTVQRGCICRTSYFCSCCQSVLILYTKAEKILCVNFTYRSTGLSIDITLNSEILRARTLTDYKPLRFCTNIPGCYFSSACVNVLELNGFPRYDTIDCNFFLRNYIISTERCLLFFSNFTERSITACPRLEIFSKKRIWQLNYDCISISTELSTMPTNGTGGMTSTMTTSSVTMTTTMVETEETTTEGDVEVITVPGEPTTVVDID
ncbi:uncharacterized protein LOC143429147 [Xylocopa sonorina]|uniref:uncharacterized protein LOC143429147 n=1 Tax=Xylocopa sonorina TaxID=1818115 RepID=UPI00403ADE46